MTIARAGTEDSTFHDMLKNTTELHWTLVPVELVDSEELGCYRERSWWHMVQKLGPQQHNTRSTINWHKGTRCTTH